MNKFEMPEYRHPDFSQEMFVNAPSVKYEACLLYTSDAADE